MPKADEIKKIIKRGEPDIWIETSRKYQHALIRHTADEGVVSFLERITKFENVNQLNLRERFYISTKHVIGFIQRPADNIWSALGGSFNFQGSDSDKDKLMEQTSTANRGRPLQTYIQEDYFDAIYDNPAGGTWVSWDEKEENIEVHQINITSIRDYERYGHGVKWILFEPEIIKKVVKDDKDKDVPTDVKRYMYIDEDWIILYDDTNGNIKQFKKVKNPYGFVPFVLNATVSGKPNIKQKVNRMAMMEPKPIIPLSVIDDEMQLMDAYLRKNSVKEVHEFLHAYPEYWKYGYQCTECKGVGEFPQSDGKAMPCTKCNGEGRQIEKKDVSNFTILIPPNTNEGEEKLDPSSGYVVPPIEIIEEMRTELNSKLNEQYRSHWGVPFTAQDRETGEAETATGRLIDIQPLVSRMNKYTNQIESAHNSIIKVIIRLIFPFTNDKVTAFKSYGRGFIIETGEIVLQKYTDARENQLSQTLLFQLLISYYATTFRSDEMKFMTMVKLANVEPFVHNTSNEIQDIEAIVLKDKQNKYYYPDWLAQMPEKELRNDTEQTLRDKLDKYVNEKIQDNGTT
ncbi:hypothetical protein KAR91_39000 [Candidatus Pacearchaeota archaeon]|nr:hypothetical protein [Candidatus Pacearchaeota archaeon]